MTLTVYRNDGSPKIAGESDWQAAALDTWHVVGAAGEPAFDPSWTNYGGGEAVAAFRKNPDGRVVMRGLVKRVNTSSATIFTLPAGYRPPTSTERVAVGASTGGAASVSLATAQVVVDGRVQCIYGAAAANDWIDLTGIEFDTETVSRWQVPVGTGPPLVGVLPTSPVDGQEVYFAADAANGVVWHLRYNAQSASAYKWECLGGSPMRQEGVGGNVWGTVESTPSLTYTTLTTPGPGVTVPLAGDYELEGRATQMGGGGNLGAFIFWITGDGAPSWSVFDAAGVPYSAANGYGSSLSAKKTRTIPANTRVEMRYATSNASTAAQFNNRSIWVRPVRVG